MIGISEHGGTPNMARNTRNTGILPPSRGLFFALLAIPLLAITLLFQNAPARAQGVYVTPTPLPAIVATTNAANASLNSATTTLSQAAEYQRLGDEMQRNGIAQYAQAQTDITAAGVAAATQNGVAAGEAIGRLGATVDEQNKTVVGQADIIGKQNKTIENQAHQIATLAADNQTLRDENQGLKIDKQTILDNYNAKAKALDDVVSQGASSSVTTLVIGALVVLAILIPIIVVLERKRSAPPPDDHADAIDAEFTKKDEAINDPSSSDSI